MKISLYKKYKLYKSYRKTIKQMSFVLENEFGLRQDRLGRLYTVLNVDPEDIKNYGPKLSSSIIQKYVNDYISKVDRTITNSPLNELVGLLEIKKIDELNYLVVFGFSLFNTVRLARILIAFGSLLLLTGLYFLFF